MLRTNMIYLLNIWLNGQLYLKKFNIINNKKKK